MSSESDFFDFLNTTEGTFELVDGSIVRKTPSTQLRALVVVNILASLRSSLRGSGFRTMRTAVPCNGNIRYPDIVVDGGDFQPDNLFATLPVLVADVLVSDDDPGSRLDDYKDNDDIYTILLVATDHFHATLHRRGEGEWSEQFFNDLDGTIELAGIGTSLRLSDIYFGLDIAPKSREP